MKNSQTALWTVGTLLAAALIAVGAYFLAISPQLEATADANDQKEQAQEFNNLLDTQILAAQAKAKEVPMWEGEMNAIAIDLPPLPEQPDLHRLVSGALAARGLPTVSITYGATQLITPPVVTDTATTETTDETTDEETTDETTDAEATPTPSAEPTDGDSPDAEPTETPILEFEGLVGIPVTVTTEGAPASILGLIADLQAQDSRFLTVTNIDLKRAETTDEKPGRRALTTSDWVVSITYFAFSLIDPELSYPTDDGQTTSPYTEGAGPNPFVPLDGTGE